MTADRYDENHEPPAPIVEVTIGTPDDARTAGLPALLDTGSEATTIPESLVEALDLVPIGEFSVVGFDGIATTAPTFLAAVTIRDQSTHVVEVVAAREPVVLLGCDVLNEFRVVLDGPRRVLEVGAP
jgi:predicted aspartyl protease